MVQVSNWDPFLAPTSWNVSVMVSSGAGALTIGGAANWEYSAAKEVGSVHAGAPAWPAYSTTMPSPILRAGPRVEPRIHTPGEFISTIASMRSATPRESTGTAVGVGTGLPSMAITLKV